MSIELPSQVVWLLNVIGVNWPDVDEDQSPICLIVLDAS